MQNDVYDYTQPAGTGAVQKDRAAKTYGLLGLSFIPCAAGAFFEQPNRHQVTPRRNCWIAFRRHAGLFLRHDYAD